MMRPKVLIVDDVRLNVFMLSAMVARVRDCEVTTFTSAVAALEWCGTSVPELILLDYAMPEMDGVTFLREVRAIEHCRTVPVLIITAEQDRTSLLRGLEAGANDFLRKPVDAVEFNARVRNALDFGMALNRLRLLATIDGLTGLPNRQTFMTRLQDECERARRYDLALSVAMIDIDHFKAINDRYGHAGGDAALVAIAATCTRILRNVDGTGRLGGEEFGIILPNAALDGAHLAVDRLRGGVAATTFTHDGQVFSATISGGVAEYGSAESPDALLARADAALYRAKASGRDRIVRAPPAAGTPDPQQAVA